mmetsp:Transcript_22954/g.37991  ORF Transcript_22954/g.37991 Transcript_22954/m.37991 type:complete len:446 (+) Transcript_22954:1-1338(+)
MTRAFDRLYRVVQHKWRGVNLGGWLLLERGPSAPFFEVNGLTCDSEWDATEALCGSSMKQDAAETFAYHRRRHVLEADFAEIAKRGFNAVRLPFGYWIVTGPTNGDPYIGPALELIDDAVEWAGRHGLEVLLDLHGNPGGETEEKPCGRGNPDWCFEAWRRDEALDVLAMLAERYRDFEHVTGLQVCNEPSRFRIEPPKLLEHYLNAVATVREAGMPPERVSVVCPCYFEGAKRRVFLESWRQACAAGELDGAVLDFHPYFFLPSSNEVTQGLISEQSLHEAQSWDLVPSAVVGEFSAAFHTFKGEPCCDKTPEGRELLNEFLVVQQDAYSQHATHGHFYWTWADNAVGWSRQAAFFDGPDAGPDDGEDGEADLEDAEEAEADAVDEAEEAEEAEDDDDGDADEFGDGDEWAGSDDQSVASDMCEAMEATISPYALRNKTAPCTG